MTAPIAPPARKRHRQHRIHRPRKEGIFERLKVMWQALTRGEPGRPQRNAVQDPRRVEATIPRRHHEHSDKGNSRQGGEHGKVVVSLSRRQLGAIALALLALGWLGFRIIADTAAQNAALSNPSAALAWNSAEASALDELALQRLLGTAGGSTVGREFTLGTQSAVGANASDETRAGLGFAVGLARRALQAKPLDARALTLLGLIAEREGDPARADALMRIAGARTWRDPITQLWLFNQDTKRGDFAGAITHSDAILRTDDGNGWGRLFPALAAFTVDPRAMQSLTAFLGDDPQWRRWFLTELSARLFNEDRLVQLYRNLQAGKTPPTTTESQPFLVRLIKGGRFDEAYRTWRETLAPERRSSDSYPHNGDFAADPDGLPFDWVLQSVPGAEIDLVASPDGGKGRALQIQFSGARVDFHNVTQLMMLPSGQYRLSERVKANNLLTQRGLWWRVSCADIFKGALAVHSNLVTLGHTKLVVGNVPWTDVNVDFEVPRGGCPAQWLTLELPARIGPEQQIKGEIWFESLRIDAITDNESQTGSVCRPPVRDE
jgi:hypothetical protein